MNRKELFTNFYNELYKEILDEYYLGINNQTRNIKTRFILNVIILTIIPIILFWILLYTTYNLISFIIITIIYCCGTIVLFNLSYKDNKKEIVKQIKYKILDDMITLVTTDEEGKVLPERRISKESFEKTSIFNFDNVKYNGSNFIQANFMNKTTIIADMNIYTFVEKNKTENIYIGSRKFLRKYKTRTKKDIFNGCYIGSTLDKKNTNLIQIIPNSLNNTINKKINNYFNLCDYVVKLENLEFSKRYTVYSNDEIKARKTLTITMLEKINSLEKIIKNKKYIIFKSDGRYALFIENITIENILDKNLDINRNDELNNLYNIYDNLYKLFELTTTLNNNE